MEDFKFCRGIKSDLLTRAPWYLHDWYDVCSLKVTSSTFFIFFTSLGPAITFALLLSSATDNSIGAVEVLFSTALTGILFSIFAGQPLVIVGVTGPVSILTISVFSLSEQWGLSFLPFYAWSQIWAAAMLMAFAMLNFCDLLRFVTRFSCEIFGILIALIYIYTGISGIALVLGNVRAQFSLGLSQFIIAIGTLFSAQYLAKATQWSIFTEDVRTLISDYGATISIIVWSTVPAMVAYRLEDDIPKLFVPEQFGTTSGRPWFVDLTDIPIWGAFAAIFPGLIIAVLFFFDHNVSSLLAQEKDMKLIKGSAFHLDFLILGVGVFLTGLLGIPPTNGLIPQAPLHAKSLMEKVRVFDSNGDPTDKFIIAKVWEQRVSNLVQSFMCGLVCFYPFSAALRQVPNAVLYGLFLFLGASSFEGNEFSYRMNMMIMEKQLRVTKASAYQFCSQLDFKIVVRFTVIQFALCSIIFVITFTEAGVIFPVLIAALIMIRLYVLPKFFTPEELDLLDTHIIDDDSTKGSEGEESDLAATGEEYMDMELGPSDRYQPASSDDSALPVPQDFDPAHSDVVTIAPSVVLKQGDI